MVADDSHNHRERLRRRFSQGSIAAFNDYEILELLLTYAIPRRDTKPLAKSLLKEFKTVHGVLQAPAGLLTAIDGVGPATAGFLSLVNAVSSYCLHEQIQRRDPITHRRGVEEYLRFAYGGRADEYVVVLFLDTANKVLSAEMVAEGTVNQCVFYPRVVIRKAILAGAAGMIIAHNHPGGTASPSEADWSLTAQLHSAGRMLDLSLLDHMIICRDRVLSLREMPRWPR